MAATGHNGPDVCRRAREAGLRHFLRNPYDPTQLRANLAEPGAAPDGVRPAPEPHPPPG